MYFEMLIIHHESFIFEKFIYNKSYNHEKNDG